MIDFDKIVNKLSKKEWQILSLVEIWSIFDPDFRKWSTKNISSIYKIIYRLKALDIIIPIKNSLYFVSNWKKIKDIEIIDLYYWKILKKIITDIAWSEYFIWNIKALEVLLNDYSVSPKIIIYNKEVDKIVTLSKKHKIIFKKLISWKKSENTNIFTKFKKFTKIININNIDLRISDEELSILDSLLIRDNKNKIDSYLINKFLNKYNLHLSREKLWELVKLKYITSINRLKEISVQNNYNSLYTHCLDIIKREWWNCFLTKR